MKYELCKNVMIDDTKRKGFDDLLHKTFKLSFEEWYQNGEWGDWNQPYTLYDGEKAVANITVNHMKALYQGKVRDYIQLGGVATDPEYRGQGLSRFIMEEVQKDWKDRCDAMFLFANKTVTEFYPKFGFVEEQQYQYRWKCEDILNTSNVRKLDLSNTEDREILKRCYQKRNPFSEIQFIDNYSLLQFYCYYGMNENMYYMEDDDALVIAEYEENQMLCYDVFYYGSKGLLQIMREFSGNDVKEVVFLFTPEDKLSLHKQKFIDIDTHLFVLQDKENIFTNQALYIPDISHT